MRKTFNLVVVVALLLFGVTSLELPELLTLVDNTSNDVAFVGSTETVPREAKSQKPKAAPRIVWPGEKSFADVNRFEYVAAFRSHCCHCSRRSHRVILLIFSAFAGRNSPSLH